MLLMWSFKFNVLFKVSSSIFSFSHASMQQPATIADLRRFSRSISDAFRKNRLPTCRDLEASRCTKTIVALQVGIRFLKMVEIAIE